MPIRNVVLLALLLRSAVGGEALPDELWKHYLTISEADKRYDEWVDAYTVSTLRSYVQLAERRDEVRRAIAGVFRKEDYFRSYRSEIEAELTVDEFRQLIGYMESSVGTKMMRASTRANTRMLQGNVDNVEILGKRLNALITGGNADRDGVIPKL
jgi:hypothetical protein